MKATVFLRNGTISNEIDQERIELEGLVSSLVGVSTRLSVANMLNADNAEIWEGVEDERMAECLMNDIVGGQANGSDTEGISNVECIEPGLCIDEKLQAIRTVMHISKKQEDFNIRLQCMLRSLLRAGSRQKTRGMR